MKRFNIIIVLMIMMFCFLLNSSVYAGIVTGTTFADIESEIVSTSNGGTVTLDSITYSGSGLRIDINNKNSLIIEGPSATNKATLDANNQSIIFNVVNTSTGITFRNINFINGDSGESTGGAIRAYHTIIVENCTFSNMEGQSGTAIMLGEGATGSIIRDCKFYNCYSINENIIDGWGWGEGAAIDSHASNTLIENCLFENNYAIKNGGVISLALGQDNLVKDCVFKNNKAEDLGGALYIRESKTTIENCEFVNNIAKYGSAIYNDLDSTLNIRNINFTENLAETLDLITPSYIVNKPDNAILKISMILGDNILDAIYNDDGNIRINGLTPVMSNSSSNQTITLTINGITYREITDTNGTATFIISTNTLSIMEYEYEVIYNQTTLFTGYSKNGTINVTENATNTGQVPGTGITVINPPRELGTLKNTNNSAAVNDSIGYSVYVESYIDNTNQDSFNDEWGEYKKKIPPNYTGIYQLKVEY